MRDSPLIRPEAQKATPGGGGCREMPWPPGRGAEPTVPSQRGQGRVAIGWHAGTHSWEAAAQSRAPT